MSGAPLRYLVEPVPADEVRIMRVISRTPWAETWTAASIARAARLRIQPARAAISQLVIVGLLEWADERVLFRRG